MDPASKVNAVLSNNTFIIFCKIVSWHISIYCCSCVKCFYLVLSNPKRDFYVGVFNKSASLPDLMDLKPSVQFNLFFK